VLLDLMMPVMDGFETLSRIKQDAGLRELPVIMISALEELQSVASCIEMGAVDYLPKPFNRVLLRARIGASLEKKRLMDRERERTNELERTLKMLEEAKEQLSVLASRDALTGLENRRSIEAQLDLRLKRGGPLSAIYIDLNGFKKINDTYGHEAGDELLRQVGKRLRMAFRSGDAIGRWGGDEFVALVDSENAQAQISRVAECMAADFAISEEQKRIRIGAAVGTAARRPGDSATLLLQRADCAMYEVKVRAAG
jgi:two-component system chemotaxis family response regulator WspR